MKKLIALILALTLLMLLVGCQENRSQNTVLKAWSGEFSEEKLKAAINEYQKDYENIILEKDGDPSISFETDFEVSSCSVSLLSRIDDTDIEVELHGYIDLALAASFDGKTVTIPVDWWYEDDDSWVNDYLVWSYLVSVKDTDGGNHYYYFRVDYSVYAK